MSNHTNAVEHRTPQEIIADIENKKLIEFTYDSDFESDLEIGTKVKVQLNKEDSPKTKKYNGQIFIYKGNKPFYPTFENVNDGELVCFRMPFYYEKVNDEIIPKFRKFIEDSISKQEQEIKQLKNLLEEIKDELDTKFWIKESDFIKLEFELANFNVREFKIANENGVIITAGECTSPHRDLHNIIKNVSHWILNGEYAECDNCEIWGKQLYEYNLE